MRRGGTPLPYLCWVNLLNLLDLLPMVHVNRFPKNVKTIPILRSNTNLNSTCNTTVKDAQKL
jgi:hypothetical protein